MVLNFFIDIYIIKGKISKVWSSDYYTLMDMECIIWWLYYPIEAHSVKKCLVWRKQGWKNGVQKRWKRMGAQLLEMTCCVWSSFLSINALIHHTTCHILGSIYYQLTPTYYF